MKMRLVILASALLEVLLFQSSFSTFFSTPFDLQITIPAGHTEGFVYADEEISPLKHALIVRTAEGTPDGEVILKDVEVKEENAYEPAYITSGLPVKIPVERGAWFKIGVNIPNSSSEELIVTLRVQSAELRIE